MTAWAVKKSWQLVHRFYDLMDSEMESYGIRKLHPQDRAMQDVGIEGQLAKKLQRATSIRQNRRSQESHRLARPTLRVEILRHGLWLNCSSRKSTIAITLGERCRPWG